MSEARPLPGAFTYHPGDIEVATLYEDKNKRYLKGVDVGRPGDLSCRVEGFKCADGTIVIRRIKYWRQS